MKNRIIVTLSGGKASAYCAKLTFEKYEKEKIILYFNDTGWEHEDLHRFLDDLEIYFDHKITKDNDGRTLEQLFIDENAIASNFMPFCSKRMKSQRLERFIQDGDTLIFGIDSTEQHRATRIKGTYDRIGEETGKFVKVEFPLIDSKTNKETIDKFFADAGIEEPLLYKLGFPHNNCSGGCVRSGRRHWKHLYDTLPEVYMERERVEKAMRKSTGRDISFMKDITLGQLRRKIETGKLSPRYYLPMTNEAKIECIGDCSF